MGMVENDQIIALGELINGLIGEGLKAALVPCDLDIQPVRRSFLGKVLGCCDQAVIGTRMIPGDTTNRQSLAHEFRCPLQLEDAVAQAMR